VLLLSIYSPVCGQVIEVDFICWTENLKLVWSDFQGIPDTAGIFVDKKAATAYQIRKYQYLDSGLPNYRITTLFFTKKSWTRDTLSALLLSHEQLHFDIAELYSRKIRKGIQELRQKRVREDSQYLALIDLMLAELDKYHNEYDKKTWNGAIDFLQEEWNAKVKKELALLKQYSTKPEDCKCENEMK
jgi:hypothetical protein